MKVIVHPGVRYRATIKLGIVEQFGVSAASIKKTLEDKGVTDVVVQGSGRNYIADGTSLYSATVDLPDQIVKIEVIG